jgi:hypothetical protein
MLARVAADLGEALFWKSRPPPVCCSLERPIIVTDLSEYKLKRKQCGLG